MTGSTDLRLESREQLARKATELRRAVIDMIYHARSGHPGGALGMADVFTVLWYRYLRDQPQNPTWPERDRFIVSNGHICPILYSILADRGYFDPALLRSFRSLGSPVQGHPSRRHPLPGIEYSGGSLGNGLSFSLGTALAGRITGYNYRVFCSVSDGDCQEGQTWEAAMAAAHYGVDNLVAIVDYNRSQIDGPTDAVMSLGDLGAKWKAFGWQTLEIDGHDLDAISQAFEAALNADGQPSVLVAHTVIGKGVSYMEGDYRWHHGVPSEEQFEQAMIELAID